MKKIVLTTMLLLMLITLQVQATYTGDQYIAAKAYLGSGNKTLDPLYLYITDATGSDTVGKSFYYAIPSTAPSATEGYFYYSAALDALVLRTASGWETLEAGGDYASLDEAYNGGAGITVDAGPIVLTSTDAANNEGALSIIQQDTGAYPAFIISNAGTDPTIEITTSGTGADITGTSATWLVSKAGVATLVGVSVGSTDIVFTEPTTNDITLLADGDGILTISAGSMEDLDLNLATSNTLTLTSSTGVDTIAFGALDAFTGVASIAGDTGADFALSAANTGTFNFTIAQAGVGDNELRLTSAGTAADAISLIASTGGITASAATSMTATSSAGAIALSATGGDVTITGADSSIVLSASEAVTDAINIDSTGGVDIDVALSISIKSTENTLDSIEIVSTAGGIDITAAGAATEDIDITNTAGSVNITAGENNANAMILKVDGGSSKTLQVLAVKGTGASAATESDASIQLESTVGGIGILSLLNGDNAIRLETNGGDDENIFIHANQGTGADSITLLTDEGGIALTGSAGSIVLTATGAASDITLTAGDILTLTSVDTKIFDGAAAETWIIEGTANDHEASVVFTDPTADVTWTFPTAATDIFAVMASTLATNAPEIANSVTGGTAELIFEGANADAHETHLTAIEATADVTLTLPDDTGAVAYIPTGSTTKDATDAAIPLTHAVVIGTSDATSSWSLPDGNPGQVLTIVIGTDGGAATLTPDSTTGDGWATMIFTNDGEGATFMFVDSTVGWTIMGTFGISTNPLITGE